MGIVVDRRMHCRRFDFHIDHRRAKHHFSVVHKVRSIIHIFDGTIMMKHGESTREGRSH
jgi:hypothetical protein